MSAGNFEAAFTYVVEDEGRYDNDPTDHGGETHYGITARKALEHRCVQHPQGIFPAMWPKEDAACKELARHVYRLDVWRFDGIRDRRLAIKVFDTVVNIGDGVRVIQRAVNVTPDGVYGPETEAALQRLPVDEAIDAISREAADKYIEIARHDAVLIAALEKAGVRLADLQLKYLKGWVRRAIRRPPVTVRQ
jgi:lysozyme family protein